MDSENPTFKSDFHFAIFVSRDLFLFFFLSISFVFALDQIRSSRGIIRYIKESDR